MFSFSSRICSYRFHGNHLLLPHVSLAIEYLLLVNTLIKIYSEFDPQEEPQHKDLILSGKQLAPPSHLLLKLMFPLCPHMRLNYYTCHLSECIFAQLISKIHQLHFLYPKCSCRDSDIPEIR